MNTHPGSVGDDQPDSSETTAFDYMVPPEAQIEFHFNYPKRKSPEDLVLEAGFDPHDQRDAFFIE